MQENPQCAVCRGRSWETVCVHQYLRDSDEEAVDGALSEYVALRHRVLFEIWFPGCEQVELRSVMCKVCGFVAYTPRPDAADVDAKYRFLQIHEKSIGGQSDSERALRWDHRRSERIYRDVWRGFADRKNGDSLRILDFGGGNGKLLESFTRRGHRCYLVDYNPQPIAGIVKLGDTLEDLEDDASFDVILCSHVLEHVVYPSEILDRLSSRLHTGGVLYTEVPFEVWRGIPIERDPVTHVNFFNLSNFMALCQRPSLGIVDARRMMSTYDVWRLEVLVVVARKGSPGGPVSFEGAVEQTRRRLQPSRGAAFHRRVRHRHFPTLGGLRRRAACIVGRFAGS